MAEVASAYVSLLPSAKGFGSKLGSQIGPDIDKSGKRSGISFGKLFAAGAALGIGAKAFSFLGDSLAEAKDAQVVGARTENVIKKMGDAANISADGVANLAGAISAKTGIDDEAIQAGQNLLLTFGNIRNEAGQGNDIFNQTTQLMTDMSAAMGTDAKGSAIQLGKALNDPVKGITALSRVGVSFTETQKEQIAGFVESGETMKAQKVILGELERQFGGAAAAMTTPGEKASVAFGNLKEQIGTALLPVVESLSTTFTTKIAPAISTFITEIQKGEGAGGRFRARFEETVGTLKKFGTFVKDNAAAIGVFVGFLATAYAAFQTFMFIRTVTTAVKAFNLMLAANPIGLVVVAIALLAAGLVLAYKKSDTFRTVVDKAFSAVSSAGKALWEGVLKPAFEGMKKGFEAVGKAGIWLWNNALQPAFKFIVSGVASILEMWSAMLGALADVPGFGWAKKAADAMANAAEKTRSFADGIDKIPTSKTVTITTVYMTRSPGKERSGGLPVNGRLGLPKKSDAANEMNAYGDAMAQALGTGLTRGLKEAGKRSRESLVKELDKLKGKLGTLKDEFAALATSVSSAFTGNLFDVSATDADAEAGVAGSTVGQNFINSLMSKKGELTSLLSSFNTLKGWGISPAFLSQLFASGNGALITELAGMGQAGATGAANLFGEVTSLGSQLGGAVATNDFGPNIDKVGNEIKELRRELKDAPKETADRMGRVIANTRIVLEGADAGQRAYLRTGR